LSTYFYCIEWDEINRHLISPLFSDGYGVLGLDKRFYWSFWDGGFYLRGLKALDEAHLEG
jgi:hypothetical protein